MTDPARSVATDARTVRERFRNLLIMGGIAVAAVAAALVVALTTNDQELKRALLTGAFGLLFGGLLGGVVKLLLDDLDRGRQQRADRARFLNTMLSDLKWVYDQTARAQTLISAHQSAATYRDEMKNLIDARVRLRNVGRAAFPEPRLKPLEVQVEAMEKYLTSLLEEYEKQFKTISGAQRIYEKRVGAYLDALVKDPSLPEELPANAPWALLTELSSMRDFLALGPNGDLTKTRYQAEFLNPLDNASLLLLAELRAVLE